MAYDRATFQELARSRLHEAKLLLREGHFSGGYYLAGYAIECALKAIIAGQFQANEIPDKSLVNSIYTHNLSDLLRLAGLQTELQTETELARSWDVVKRWSESARYVTCDSEVATALLSAIGGDDEGIFQWLTKRW